MATIDRIVNVQIALQDAAIAQQSFSDMLVVWETTHALTAAAGGVRVSIITDPSDLLAAPFSMQATDPAYLAVADAFSPTPHTNQVYVGVYSTAGAGGDISLTNALSAMRAVNDSWYGLVLPDRSPARIAEAAAWTEANGKLFGTAVNEIEALDPASTTDTVAVLKQGNYFRTFAFYHALAATDFPEAATMSKAFTKYPGQETWANQELGGVTADALSETGSAAVRGKNGNTFETFRNLTITQGGKVAGGEWIDVIRFRDWLAEQVKINVFGLLVDNRVPYTDPGIRQVASMVQQALDLGVRRGGIAPEELDDNNKVIKSYVLSVPKSADIARNDKVNCVLNDLSFTARLAGAIHAVNINGTLSFTLTS